MSDKQVKSERLFTISDIRRAYFDGALSEIGKDEHDLEYEKYEDLEVEADRYGTARANALTEDGARPVRVNALVSLLTELRSHWVEDRDEKTYGSPQWMGKHQGVYALDEAIKTIKAGELKRYKDEGITIP
ncbi:hypothetical protein [Halalkalibaculum sp. DA384]|uniref:hypothetical protein n=1 Tax=Halalkalibaculum sp. DA384 TaxID=3373606 RepID=UPI0037547039